MAQRGTMAVDLENVLKALHDAGIRFGIQSEPSDGGITAWIDCGDRMEIATFFGHMEGDYQVWRAGDIASWLLETSMRLDPEWRHAAAELT
jgi:hypothetical protein